MNTKRAGFLILGSCLAILLWSLLPWRLVIKTQTGFYPSSIRINRNGWVTFINLSSRQFWPASNTHPSHTIYSEFDSQKAISPGGRWTFQFSRTGRWEFHDHLSARATGLIEVGESERMTNDTCDNSSGKIQCWESVMQSILEQQGIDAAFEWIADTYAGDSEFEPVCHDFVHKLGKAAYVQFSQKGTAVLSPNATFCGYGFYHGFMETLLTTTGTVQQAQAFCEEVQKELGDQTLDAGGACYHGIGHGVADPHQEDYFSSIQELIDPGLRICEQVSNTPDKLWRCATGVYNVAEIAGTAGSYGFILSGTDPFATCHVQPVEYQSACYPNFAPVAIRLASGDFAKALSFLPSITNDEYKVSALVAIAVEEAHTRGSVAENVRPSIATCRTLETSLHLSCVAALAEGFLKYGLPQKEYEQALIFCDDQDFTSAERNACYSKVLGLLPIWYSAAKTAQICKIVPNLYQQYCPTT